MANHLQIQSFIGRPHPILLLSPSFFLPNPIPISKSPSSLKISATHLRISSKHHSSTEKPAPLLETPPRNQVGNSPTLRIPLPFLVFSTVALPSFAAETDAVVPDKINIEAIVIAIDDFFNRNPFFVAGVTFIWLVVVPLTQEYLKKCKMISAIDAFRKLRDAPDSQLLDIRKKRSVRYLGSPNLKFLNKSVVQVEFVQGKEDGFVKEVMKSFQDPGNAVICVLDNFDGDSLKVAELLHKNGFKEAYAIKGGLRGKDGWQAIQETLLPPSMHVYPKKKNKASNGVDNSEKKISENGSFNGQLHPSSDSEHDLNEKSDDLYGKPSEAPIKAEVSSGRPLSPYPNYEDLKPPSSPTPSKPQ